MLADKLMSEGLLGVEVYLYTWDSDSEAELMNVQFRVEVSGHILQSSHTFFTSFKPFLLKEGGGGGESISRGDCE